MISTHMLHTVLSQIEVQTCLCVSEINPSERKPYESSQNHYSVLITTIDIAEE